MAPVGGLGASLQERVAHPPAQRPRLPTMGGVRSSDTEAVESPRRPPPAVCGDSVPSRPASTHRPGNWRSLVISMIVMTFFVLGWVALQPKPSARERATVDVARASSQLAAEKRWPLGVLAVGEDWHPTQVSLRADDAGVQTWSVGYHHRPGDDRYVTVTQTRSGEGIADEIIRSWLTRQVRSDRPEGTTSVAGRTWTLYTGAADGRTERVRRSLVAQGQDAPGELITVISGEVDQETLERMAGLLRQTAVPAASSPSPTASP